MSSWWVVDFKPAKDGLLRPVVIGGRSFASELKAQSYIDDANLTDKAEIFEADTSSTAKATREIKAKLIVRYGHKGPGEWTKGLKRAVHKVDV